MNIPDTNLLYKEIDGEKKLCISYSQLDTFLQCPNKWYNIYILGRRSTKKSEATSYGTCVHQTMEHFFGTGRALTRQQLCDTFCYFADKEEIPFEDVASQIKAYKDSMSIINWVSDIYERNEKGEFIKPKEKLSKIEYIFRMSNVAGVEEDFVLKYRLPSPININGREERYVHFVGSLDLHLEKNGFHTVIDWKSDGKGYYTDDKLKKGLQHPIYAMYVLKKYGKLPDICYYVHTRSQVCEAVIVDRKSLMASVDSVNDALKQMYSFASEAADKLKEKDSGFDEFDLVKITDPDPLCYWCDFSTTSGDKSCKDSSSYVKKKK